MDPGLRRDDSFGAGGRPAMIHLLEQVLNGAQFGVMLFLMAAGLTLIFGIMNLINLAHGSLYMVGAYVAAAVFAATGSFLLALLAAAWAASAMTAPPSKPIWQWTTDERLAARLDERVVELERLWQRRAEVVLAVQDQGRRAAVAGVVDGPAPRVLARRVVRFGLQEEPVELADVRRRVEADPVGHDREWHRGGEAVGLRDRP